MSPLQPSSKTITVILNGKLAFPLAPENISTVPLYHIHKNLWDTVVADGGSPGLARLLSVETGGTTFRFEMRPEAQLSNGRKVISGDIDFSLKRLMGRQPGGHFNAKSAIKKIEVLDDAHFNIVLSEPTASFLFLLSTPEMGIVPKEACDDEGNVKSLAITSGPYTVEGMPTTDRLILSKNPHFSRHSPQSPNRLILLLPGTADGMVQAAVQGHADLMEAYDGVGIEAFQRLKGNNDFTHSITKPSASFFLVNQGDRLSGAQRLALAALVREKFAHYYHLKPEIEQLSSQLLPPGTFGSLDSLPSLPGSLELPKKVRLVSTNPTMPLTQAIVGMMSEAGIQVEVADFGSDLSKADVVLRGQGMNSDFPEIEFYLALVSEWASIPATETEKARVMHVIHSVDQSARQKQIQRIGADLISDARVIPLIVRSYVNLFRKGRVDFDQVANYDGDLPFWRMRVIRE